MSQVAIIDLVKAQKSDVWGLTRLDSTSLLPMCFLGTRTSIVKAKCPLGAETM
jgi:hypothetical protein